MKTTEDINRVLAERVMKWWVDEGDLCYNDSGVAVCHLSKFNPCQNASQFNECFERASEELQHKAVSFWWYTNPNTDNLLDSVRRWQLTSLEVKCRALAEVVEGE